MSPRAIGYIHSTSSDQSLWRAMREYATAEGLALDDVYVDTTESGTAAFARMMGVLRVGDFEYVLVPSLDHLARIGSLQEPMRVIVQERSGARGLGHADGGDTS